MIISGLEKVKEKANRNYTINDDRYKVPENEFLKKQSDRMGLFF
jgi:hypothetical protein